MIVSVKHNLFIHQLLLDWQHVSTLRSHHQAFIVNKLILESCVHSWDPEKIFAKDKCERFVSIGHKAIIQGGSNMTGTDFFVNKPHCDVQVSVW
jgi:hypothetical protein